MELETLKIANELKEKIEVREKMLDVLQNSKNPTLTCRYNHYDYSYNYFNNECLYIKEFALDDEMVKSLIVIISQQKEKLEKELEELWNWLKKKAYII